MAHADAAEHALPAPAIDKSPTTGHQTAVFSGGCFWGVQGVFEHVKGVTRAVSGYAGGRLANPSYEQVSSGATGHAESVRDHLSIRAGKLWHAAADLLHVALDPTQKDRQGPDWGTQYRSELFVKVRIRNASPSPIFAQLEAAHAFSHPIVTRIDAAGPFYPAEAYHQDYLDLHPTAPYIAINDIPKVRLLQAMFPENWQSSPVKVGELAADD